METCCGVRYGLPHPTRGVLAGAYSLPEGATRSLTHSLTHSLRTSGLLLVEAGGGGAPPPQNLSLLQARPFPFLQAPTAQDNTTKRHCSLSAWGRGRSSDDDLALLWFGWFRRGRPYSPFQGPAVAHGTPSAYLRGALRRTGGDRNSENCFHTLYNLTYGCYGQRPPLKVNELGGLRQPKKEKKALARATAGVGERVCPLPGAWP